MKLKLISFFIIVITLCSCQSLKLSKLTKDIVDLYIEQSKERIENLIVYTWEDDTYIGVTIHNEHPGEYISCGDNWWGIVRYKNHDVVIFGAPVQYYFTVKNITPQERACRECDMLTFYDPTEWHITLYKDNLEVCNSLSDKYDPDLPIDDLKELVESHIHK